MSTDHSHGLASVEPPAERVPREPPSRPVRRVPVAAGPLPDLEGLVRELQAYVVDHEAWQREAERLEHARRALAGRHWELLARAFERLATCRASHAEAHARDHDDGAIDLNGRTACYERALLRAALERAGGCQRKASTLLGVLPTTLHEKLKRLGLRAPRG